jgi:hypothetical protein
MKKTILIIFLVSVSIIAQDVYRMDVNQIILPFDREGLLADVIIDPYPVGARFAENNNIYIFSAGFFLSGLNADTVWANVVLYPRSDISLFKDYQAGNVDSLPTDPKYKIYILKSADGDFAQSWVDWKNAVNLGADFYDGDNDGLYNPVDLNGNNQWDPNEDRPDLIGNFTAWCVYNDGVPAHLRKYGNEPLGI